MPTANTLSLTNRCEHVTPEQINQLLQESPLLSPTLAKLCIARGVSSGRELVFSLKHLIPSSHLMGLDDALRLLDTTIDSNQKILIVGDFDCDGATSTALMVRVLKDLGADVDYLVPDRFKYGYGLTPELVTLGIERFQPALIVTVDNGISSHEGVAKAQEHGVKVIITDHHLTTKEKPPAEAVVNPNQLGCDFASKALVGVGVAFYVLGTLSQQRKQAGKSHTQVTQYMDMVALGTVADVGALDANNRRLVVQGLQQINAGNACYGIKALIKVAGRDKQPLRSSDFGFVLGPRINAAGRMDDMSIGIQCLLAEDMETAMQLAEKLETLNQKRRSVETNMREEAMQMLAEHDEFNQKLTDDKRSIVLYEPSWHQGVIGIVAGRLKERFYKPTIVFAPSDDSGSMLKGSARSITGVHIRDAIERVTEKHPDLVLHFGGHAMAAGLSLTPDKFDAFAQAFEEVLQSFEASIFASVTYSDGALATEDYTLAFAEQLKFALPWGQILPCPCLMMYLR